MSRNDRDRWLERASEYVDDELSDRERRAFEEHLPSCPECRSAVEGMRQVAAHASMLDKSIEPARDLWPGIERRLQPRTVSAFTRIARSFGVGPRGFSAWLRPQLVAACMLLVATAAVIWFIADSRRVAPPNAGTPPVTAQSGPTAPLERVQPVEDPAYESTVAKLEREVRRRLTADPHVVQVVDENVATLDASIATYRDALLKQPGDQDLRNRLNTARQKKLAILEQAVTLTNEGLN